MMGHVHEPSLEEVQGRLSRALSKLCANEGRLIVQDVNGRSITHHLAIYLQKKFADWNVDVEYNRNLGDIKRLNLRAPGATPDDTHAVTVFPDVIVHHRGTAENLLVVEVKKATGSNHQFDLCKLRAFTTSLPPTLGYRWGVHVVLPAASNDLPCTTWFEDGAEI